MQDGKMTDNVAGVENDRLENDGLENDGRSRRGGMTESRGLTTNTPRNRVPVTATIINSN